MTTPDPHEMHRYHTLMTSPARHRFTLRMICAVARVIIVLLTCVRAEANGDDWTFVAMALVIGLTLARSIIRRGDLA